MTGARDDDPPLHLFSPQWPHDDAWIHANRAGLLALRAAVDAALADAQQPAAVVARAFVSDGEGFALFVLRDDESWQAPAWQKTQLPYTEERGDGDVNPPCDRIGSERYVALSREGQS